MKAGRLWVPRLGVRRIVTVDQIFEEDFVNLPPGPFFRRTPVCVAGPARVERGCAGPAYSRVIFGQ